MNIRRITITVDDDTYTPDHVMLRVTVEPRSGSLMRGHCEAVQRDDFVSLFENLMGRATRAISQMIARDSE